MKINFIIPFKRMSGGIRVIYIYANYLVEQGHDVCCYLPAISYKGKGQSVAFRIKASISNAIKKETWFDCHFPVKVVAKITNSSVRDADVVIASAWQTAYDVNRLMPQKGKKYYFVQGYEVFNGEKEDVENTYRLGIPMITISNALRAQLSPFAKDIQVVHNGLFDEEFFHDKKPETERFTVMCLAHEEEYKGTKEALVLIERLKEKYNDIYPIIFGRKIDCTVPDDFEILENPPREVLMKAYQRADVYLFTSTIDAWGLPVVEAMANKCAVVGRKIGALDDLYEDKNAGIIDSTEAFFEKLCFLHDHREQLKQMQQKGYETAQNLRWEVSAKKFEDIICNKR